MSGFNDIDLVQTNSLLDILNVTLTGDSWMQASLPVHWGGIGVRRIVDLAPSACLASTYLVQPLVAEILTPISLYCFESAQFIAQTSWLSIGNLIPPSGSIRPIQWAWDDAVCSIRIQHLLEASSGSDRARILASGVAASGSWIHALLSSMGFHLSDQEIRISVGLRLGVPLVSPHTCICGQMATTDYLAKRVQVDSTGTMQLTT